MKKFLFMAFMATIWCAGRDAAAQTAQQPCDCITLTGEQPDPYRLLTADSCYLLEECYIVPDGYELEIEPGTVIFGDVATKGSLIIKRGGILTADGQPDPMTAPDPIIFTSGAPVNSRAPGDWGGITILGRAVNNVPVTGLISIDRSCGTFTGGGVDDDDNSGILRYVQIHYAGGGVSGDDAVNGLTLVSVGYETVIEYVQVTHSLMNGFSYLGGAVNGKRLAGYNNIRNDYRYELGYHGLGQFLLSLRPDPGVYDVGDPSESNGILAENNDDAPSFASSPLTNPVLSNVSIFGPKYCDTSVSTGAVAGFKLQGNTAGNFFNSFVSGYPVGLFIQDDPTILNAQNDLINFGYSTFYRNSDQFDNDPPNFDPNSDFCVMTIEDWMINVFSFGCEEPGNQVFTGSPEYHNSICNETYCGSGNRPSFVLSTNNMAAPDFDAAALDDLFFTKTGISYRGAFGATDWTVDWTNWCPAATNYCPDPQQRSSLQAPAGLHIAPNPAGSTAYVLFDAMQTGSVQVSVLDKVSGQPLRVASNRISDAGAQRVAVPLDGLQAGVYVVKVTLPDGRVLTGQLFVF